MSPYWLVDTLIVLAAMLLALAIPVGVNATWRWWQERNDPALADLRAKVAAVRLIEQRTPRHRRNDAA
jgi:hypothetical protein